MGDDPQPAEAAQLHRHFGLLHATALNVIAVVGAGVFLTIPMILGVLPGPWALLGWLAAGVLVLADSLVWSELAAAIPGSGGSYQYLLQCYGRERWGRLMAFLFVWQFLISGPLEIASGLIAVSTFVGNISPETAKFDADNTTEWVLGEWHGGGDEEEAKKFFFKVGPVRLAVAGLAILLLALLYRRITVAATLTVTFWIGVVGVIAWILIEGALRFNPTIAFALPETDVPFPKGFAGGLGAAMMLAIYAYIGYYNVCYISDEVNEPSRTIPRSIQLTALLSCVLFVGVHLAMLGTVPWQTVPKGDDVNLPAIFMTAIHGEGAAILVSLLLIWSCIGSTFAALLGYSRIPYGAARNGHFFAIFGRVHPVHHIPHLSLLLIGAMTLFWSFFDLANVISALIMTRILQQFIGQIIGLALLRKYQPERPLPYRMMLYPLPSLIALAGWTYVYVTADRAFIALSLATLLSGLVAFFVWSWWTRRWPFGMEPALVSGQSHE